MLKQNQFEKYNIMKNHAGFTVEKYLKEVLHLSSRNIQKLTHSKGILLHNKVTFLNYILKINDTLCVVMPKDTDYGVAPENGLIEILYEDPDVIILNKPAFQLVHPAGSTQNHTLANFLAYYFQSKNVLTTIRPLHRLDRDTSGCILFAKNSYTQTQLEKQLKDRTLKRCYLALIQGNLEPHTGTIQQAIAKHPTKPNQRIVNANGDAAITHYKTLQIYNENCALLELNLDTGRTHQIRVHLSHLGHAIIGDKMYGTRSCLITRQALHAHTIEFHHPTTNQRIKLCAPLPPDMQNLIHFYQQ